MATELESNNIKQGEASPFVAFFRQHHFLVALICICALEIFTFGSLQKKIGFYLDDWYTINVLDTVKSHVGHDFYQFYRGYLVADSRVVARPLEALIYVIGFLVFGLKPFGYHVFNVVCEVVACFLLYATLFELCELPALSLVAALLLVVFPNHDATRYWASCSAETLSLALSMGSIYLMMLGAKRADWRFHVGGILCFAASVFCYETFMPLILFNLLGAGWLYWRKNSLKMSILKVVPLGLSFVGVVACLLCYSRLIAPKLAVAQIHPIKLDAGMMWRAVSEGFMCNQPFYAIPFYWEQIGRGIPAYFSGQSLLALLAVVAVISTALCWNCTRTARQSDLNFLFALSVVIFFSSYTIFGVNPEYVPTLMTLVNRVNYGAAVGVSILIAAAVQWLWQRRQWKAPLMVALVVPMLVFYSLADRGLAQPWLLSWYTQTSIRDAVSRNAASFHNGDSVLLANCPRYVMWAPLYDGVWDFQSMLRLTLKDNSIVGGVVSERMVMTPESVKDISRGVLCGEYKFGKLLVIVPPQGLLFRVDSPEQFLDVIKEHGFGFYLDKKVLGKWRGELDQQK